MNFKPCYKTFIMELKDRELAIRWWNRKSTQEKTELAKKQHFQKEILAP